MNLSTFEYGFLSDIIAIPSVGGTPEPGCPYGRKSREVLSFFLKTAEENGFRTDRYYYLPDKRIFAQAK